MSDERIRSLERAASQGDTEALEQLIRAHQRAGDQEALCGMGWHDVDASRPEREEWEDLEGIDPIESRRINLDGQPYWGQFGTCTVAVCCACHARLPVQWAKRRRTAPTFGEMRAQMAELVRIYAELAVYMNPDGTAELADPTVVRTDRPIGIAVDYRVRPPADGTITITLGGATPEGDMGSGQAP